MILRESDPNLISKQKGFKATRLQLQFKKFLEMDIKLASCELETDEYCSISSAQASINRSARHFKVPVRAIAIHSKLYLMNLTKTYNPCGICKKLGIDEVCGQCHTYSNFEFKQGGNHV